MCRVGLYCDDWKAFELKDDLGKHLGVSIGRIWAGAGLGIHHKFFYRSSL